QAASDDAAKHNDTIAKPCWDANLALLKGLPSQWESPPPDIGIALGIQIQRDLLNSITGNDASSLKVLRADFQHLRRWRKSVEQAQSYPFKAVITVIVTGFVGAVWLGIKVMLGK